MTDRSTGDREALAIVPLYPLDATSIEIVAPFAGDVFGGDAGTTIGQTPDLSSQAVAVPAENAGQTGSPSGDTGPIAPAAAVIAPSADPAITVPDATGSSALPALVLTATSHALIQPPTAAVASSMAPAPGITVSAPGAFEPASLPVTTDDGPPTADGQEMGALGFSLQDQVTGQLNNLSTSFFNQDL